MCVHFPVEHAFEVVIQGVRGLKLLETMIWGEADCFVQYFFPMQAQNPQQGPTVVLGELADVSDDSSNPPEICVCCL